MPLATSRNLCLACGNLAEKRPSRHSWERQREPMGENIKTAMRIWIVRPSAKKLGAWIVVACLAVAAALPCHAAPSTCKRLVLEGEASAGQEWSTPIGEGWRFRLVPIPPLHAGYSGWDLVVDRMQPAGFPDALYLATPPYNSINEREIGTTYGLRSQDAIGWNPRSFHFLTDPSALQQAQKDYRLAFELHHDSVPDPLQPQMISAASARLLKLAERASPGELRILDAHISPGVADPAPYAQGWARASSLTQHELDPAASGKQAAAGSLNWMRFQVVLWLPDDWKLPPAAHAAAAACGQ